MKSIKARLRGKKLISSLLLIAMMFSLLPVGVVSANVVEEDVLLNKGGIESQVAEEGLDFSREDNKEMPSDSENSQNPGNEDSEFTGDHEFLEALTETEEVTTGAVYNIHIVKGKSVQCTDSNEIKFEESQPEYTILLEENEQEISFLVVADEDCSIEYFLSNDDLTESSQQLTTAARNIEYDDAHSAWKTLAVNPGMLLSVAVKEGETVKSRYTITFAQEEKEAKITKLEIDGLQHDWTFNPDKYDYTTVADMMKIRAAKSNIEIMIEPSNSQCFIEYRVYQKQGLSAPNKGDEHIVKKETLKGSWPQVIQVNMDNAKFVECIPVEFTVVSRAGIEEKVYKINLLGQNPQVVTLANLQCKNIVDEEKFKFRPNDNIINLQVDHDNPIELIPKLKDSRDKLYFVEDEEEPTLIEDERSILIEPPIVGTTKTVKLTAEPYWDLKYKPKTYEVKLERVEIATIDELTIEGAKEDVKFSPKQREYIISSGEKVNFSLKVKDEYDVWLQEDDGEEWQILDGAFEVKVSKGKDKIIKVAIRPPEDSIVRPGQYTFILKNGLTFEQELQRVEQLLSRIVEVCIEENVPNDQYLGNVETWQPADLEWFGMDLMAVGYGEKLDKEEYVDKVVAPNLTSKNNSDEYVQDWAKSTLNLLALGYTPENLERLNIGEKEYNLFSTGLSRPETFLVQWIAANPLVNQAYDNAYGAGQLQKGRELATSLKGTNGRGSYQNPNGSYMDSHTGGIDGTAMTIAGLAPYYGKEEWVTKSVDKALTYLQSNHNKESGNFTYGNHENSQSMSMVIIALCALGIDPNDNEYFMTVKGEGLIDIFLREWVNDEGVVINQQLKAKNEFGVPTDWSNYMATEQGFRALAAYRGFLVNDKKPFNVYDASQYSNNPAVPLPATVDNLSISQIVEFSYNPYDRVYKEKVSYQHDGITFTVNRAEDEKVMYQLPNQEPQEVVFADGEKSASFTLNDLAIGNNECLISVIPSGDTSNQCRGQYMFYIERLPEGGGSVNPISTVDLEVSTSQESNFNFDFIKNNIEIRDGDTAWDVIKKALDEQGLVAETTGSGQTTYIAGIGTSSSNMLSEFDCGKNSGWMYTVNGRFPQVGVGSYYLEDGDRIKLYYVTDYKKENTGWQEENEKIEGIEDAKLNELLSKIKEETLRDKEIAQLAKDYLDEVLNRLASLSEKEQEQKINELAKTMSILVEQVENVSALTDVLVNIIKAIAPYQKDNGIEIAQNALDRQYTIKLSTNRITQKEGAMITGGKDLVKALTKALESAKITLAKPLQPQLTVKVLNDDQRVTIEPSFAMAMKQEGIDRCTLAFTGGEVIIPQSQMAKGKELPARMKAEQQFTTIEVGTSGQQFSEPLTFRLPATKGDRFTTVMRIDSKGQQENMGGRYDQAAEQMVLLASDSHHKYKVEPWVVHYSDLDRHQWAKEAIQCLGAKGIIAGKEANQFAPADSITRAEFAALLVRMTKGIALDENRARFDDVQPEDWYADVVYTAVSRGYLNGKGQNAFDPMAKITRQEMAGAMANVLISLGYSSSNQDNLAQFNDQQQIAPWAKQGANMAIEYGLIKGVDGKFAPEQYASRAEAAAMMERLYQFIIQ